MFYVFVLPYTTDATYLRNASSSIIIIVNQVYQLIIVYLRVVYDLVVVTVAIIVDSRYNELTSRPTTNAPV